LPLTTELMMRVSDLQRCDRQCQHWRGDHDVLRMRSHRAVPVPASRSHAQVTRGYLRPGARRMCVLLMSHMPYLYGTAITVRRSQTAALAASGAPGTSWSWFHSESNSQAITDALKKLATQQIEPYIYYFGKENTKTLSDLVKLSLAHAPWTHVTSWPRPHDQLPGRFSVTTYGGLDTNMLIKGRLDVPIPPPPPPAPTAAPATAAPVPACTFNVRPRAAIRIRPLLTLPSAHVLVADRHRVWPLEQHSSAVEEHRGA
jgi:hypothetical protein